MVKRTFFFIVIFLCIFSDSNSVNDLDLKVFNYKGEFVDLLALGNKQIIIFSEMSGCHYCYQLLNNAVKSIKLKFDENLNISSVVRCGNSDLDKKLTVIYLKKFIQADNYFFDIQDIRDSSFKLFDYYKIRKTPSVLVVRDTSLLYLDNELLFKENTNIENLLLKSLR